MGLEELERLGWQGLALKNTVLLCSPDENRKAPDVRSDAAILGPQTLRDFSLLKADGDWWSGDWKKGGGLTFRDFVTCQLDLNILPRFLLEGGWQWQKKKDDSQGPVEI